jgi:hypothetical protein
VKFPTFSKDQKIQSRIRKLWSVAVLIFFIQLGVSILIGLLVISVPENRQNSSLLETVGMFTVGGFVLAFWLVKWILSILWNLPSFVLSEWRYAFLFLGMLISYIGVEVRSDLVRARNRAEQIRFDHMAQESLAPEEPINVETASSQDLAAQLVTYQELIDRYVDEIEENEDDFINSYRTGYKPLSVDELHDRETYLDESIIRLKMQIDLIKKEIEERENDEAWYEEVLRDEE